MVKGGDELARSRIQSLAVLSALAVRIRAPSELNATSLDAYPDDQRRRSVCPKPHPRAWRCCLRSPSGSERRSD